MQRSILEVLDEKHGMASTRTLKNALQQSDISNQSFYRSIQSLEKRGEIKFYRGGRTGGLVCRTHGNVLLVDFDSKMPNLAIMKISAWHKAKGDTVTLQRGPKIADGFGKYDIVYISCVFTKNARSARRLAKLYSTSTEVHLGGSGVDLKTTLPANIESLMPDYSIYHSIYPETTYTSYGFNQRGCIRNCDFCCVPRKEGKAHAVGDIYDFWDKGAGHTKLIIFDNNILALPDHFAKIASQIKKNNLKVDFNQSLDIRLITPENAKILAGLKFSPYMRFSWDSVKIESAVLRGIKILKENGALKYPAVWDVLCGYDSAFEEDLYRINTLRDLGQKAFVMFFNGSNEDLYKKDIRYSHLMNWTNSRVHFYSRSFDEYCKNKENGVQKQMASERKERLETKKNPPPILHGCEIGSIEL